MLAHGVRGENWRARAAGSLSTNWATPRRSYFWLGSLRCLLGLLFGMSEAMPPPRYKQVGSRKKMSLAIGPGDGPGEAAGSSGAPVLTAAGSLRAGDISVGLAGLRVKSDTPERRGLPSVGETSGAPARSFKAVPTSDGGDQMALEEFVLLRDLGEGTSGVVQLVRHKPTGRSYAKKVINLGCSDQERKQILMEVRTLHKSAVPGIIAFKNAFYADNAVHIVLEYMNCGSLASVLQRHGPLPEPLLARVSSDVLGGVDHLHRVLKVVHRDIKPANVLLNERAEVKLADFGMSGQLANTFGRLASWVGTAAYMSPERISGAEYSYETDIWALGVTLWECSVGRYPYAAVSSAQAPKARPDAPPPLGKQGSGSLLPGDEQKTGITFWDLLYSIVECPPPPLPAWESCGLTFSPHFTQVRCEDHLSPLSLNRVSRPVSRALLCSPSRPHALPPTQIVHDCMQTDGPSRPSATELLRHPWLAAAGQRGASLTEWLEVEP